MYHSISDRWLDGVHDYFQTSTSPEVFSEHMQFLHEHEYSVLNLHDPLLLGSREPRGRAVIVTFDDGLHDFYTHAFPVLSRYGFSATMFLPTDFIGNTARQFQGQDCMTWSQVLELSRGGVDFGSHTVTHPQLRSMTRDAQRYEVTYSKQCIEDKIGCEVKSFSYPFAFPDHQPAFTKAFRDLLVQAGYSNGVSTIIGTVQPTDDAFCMKRLPANSSDDPALFHAKLEGSYDWLHRFQYSYKVLRSRIACL